MPQRNQIIHTSILCTIESTPLKHSFSRLFSLSVCKNPQKRKWTFFYMSWIECVNGVYFRFTYHWKSLDQNSLLELNDSSSLVLSFRRILSSALVCLVIPISNEIYFSSVSPPLENSSTLVHYASKHTLPILIPTIAALYFFFRSFIHYNQNWMYCGTWLAALTWWWKKSIHFEESFKAHRSFHNASNTLLMEFQVINCFFLPKPKCILTNELHRNNQINMCCQQQKKKRKQR